LVDVSGRAAVRSVRRSGIDEIARIGIDEIRITTERDGFEAG
jgi:hypothetical protein